MIDYQSIPIHLRCTNRHLIDSDYDACAYHGETDLRERDHDEGRPLAVGQATVTMSDKAHYLVQLLKAYGELPTARLWRDLGLRNGMHLIAIVNNLMRHHPVYETKRNGETYYGILGITDV